MALETLVSLGDIEDRLGRQIGDAEVSRVYALISDAAILLETDAELSVVTDLAAGTISEAAVIMVISNMVRRALVGPEGVQSAQTGPFQVTYANPDSNVFLKAAERASLMPVPTPRARCVRMGY